MNWHYNTLYGRLLIIVTKSINWHQKKVIIYYSTTYIYILMYVQMKHSDFVLFFYLKEFVLMIVTFQIFQKFDCEKFVCLSVCSIELYLLKIVRLLLSFTILLSYLVLLCILEIITTYRAYIFLQPYVKCMNTLKVTVSLKVL